MQPGSVAVSQMPVAPVSTLGVSVARVAMSIHSMMDAGLTVAVTRVASSVAMTVNGMPGVPLTVRTVAAVTITVMHIPVVTVTMSAVTVGRVRRRRQE